MIVSIAFLLALGALAWAIFSIHVSADDLNRLVSQGAYLLDVRSDEEFTGGHIAGANHIHYSEVNRRIGELPADRRTPIVLYCYCGGRSAWAGLVLRLHGYRHVYDFAGGARQWARENRPFVR
jgi:rhodanese-related sulfurtransferase